MHLKTIQWWLFRLRMWICFWLISICEGDLIARRLVLGFYKDITFIFEQVWDKKQVARFGKVLFEKQYLVEIVVIVLCLVFSSCVLLIYEHFQCIKEKRKHVNEQNSTIKHA